MTIEHLTPVSRYLGDGVQRAFPTGFPVFGDGRHVKAVISTGSGSGLVERRLVYGADYAVAEISNGGECTTTAPVPSGHTLTLYLDLPAVQPRDFDNQGRLDAEEIEKGLDYLTALAARNAADIARAVKISIASDEAPKTAEELYSEVSQIADRAEQAVTDAEHVLGRTEEVSTRANEQADRAEQEADRAHAQADRAESRADQIQALSISVGPAPEGEIAHGYFNPDTGMLHLFVPVGPTGKAGADGLSIQGQPGKDGRTGDPGPPGELRITSVTDVNFGFFEVDETGMLHLLTDRTGAVTIFSINEETGNLEVSYAG